VVSSQQSSEALQPFVRAYAQRTTFLDVPPQIVPPRLEQTLHFDFGTPVEVCIDGHRPIPSPPAVVIGAHTHAGVRVQLRKGVESFVVFFRPGGFSELFGIPMRHFANTHAEADAVLGLPLRRIWEQLGCARSFADRVVIIERFLTDRLALVTPSIIALAANELLRLRGTPQISLFAATFGFEVRQFERRFLREMGISPKLFARVARFQTALDWKLTFPNVTWRYIAHELEYHDQMHLVHDFSKLGGTAPSRIIETIGDARPHALITSEEF
jgi:AraC-like DNA-binding protein